MLINRQQIDAIRRSEALSDFVASALSDPALLSKPTHLLSDAEWNDLEEACWDAATNHSPIVEEYSAEQSKGVYSICVYGVPGTYFVLAPEFEPAGVFSTLAETKSHIDDAHGEFLITEDSQYLEDVDLEPEEDNSLPHQLINLLSEGDPSRIHKITSLIEQNPAWDKLARGQGPFNENPDVLKAVAAFEKSLPPVTGVISGQARMFHLAKLKPIAQLYLEVTGQIPDKSTLQKLYESNQGGWNAHS